MPKEGINFSLLFLSLIIISYWDLRCSIMQGENMQWQSTPRHAGYSQQAEGLSFVLLKTEKREALGVDVTSSRSHGYLVAEEG